MEAEGDGPNSGFVVEAAAAAAAPATDDKLVAQLPSDGAAGTPDDDGPLAGQTALGSTGGGREDLTDRSGDTGFVQEAEGAEVADYNERADDGQDDDDGDTQEGSEGSGTKKDGRNGREKKKQPINLEAFREWVLQPDLSIPPERQKELWWYSASPPVPKRSEDSLYRTLLKYGKRERGMMCSQPRYRVQKIRQKCQQLKMPLLSALSLRRHHIHRMNPYVPREALRLGTEEQVRTSAQCFEEDIAEFLESNLIPTWTEEDQKQHIHAYRKENPDTPFPPTPDFVLKEPVKLVQYRLTKAKKRENRKRQTLATMAIHWIEVKMFYGASTIENDGKTAVGKLRSTAEKYVRVFGPGAFVFCYGYGDKLAADLKDIGAMCLDCTGRDIPCKRQRDHIRTYCCDDEGNVLI